MTRTRRRCFLFAAVLGITASSSRRIAFALSRNSIPTNIPQPPSVTGNGRPFEMSPAEMTTRNTGHGRTKNKNAELEKVSSSTMQSRKQALHSLSLLAGSVLTTTVSPLPSHAFDRDFPDELADDDQDDDKAMGVLVGKRSNAQQRKREAIENKKKLDQNLASFSPKQDALPSLTWGLALFFASGSRSNPLAKPLANLLYDPQKEKWLQDRNAGLFSPLPLEFLVLLGILFVVLGTITQYTLLQLSGGDSGVIGQLAGVALINGGFFELARIASGEKGLTRDENDREVQLKEEFDEFAEKRLKQGGNCHRSDVVKSFRRYFAKYRQADSEQYPLTDREVEKLLRNWNREVNMGRAEMRSTGFYYGIQINSDADVFY